VAVVILRAYNIWNWLLLNSGGLHEKHVVATWNSGNHLSIYSNSYWQHDYLQEVQTKTTQFYNILDRVSLCEQIWTPTSRVQFSLLLLHHSSEARQSPMVLQPTVWAPADRCIWIIGIIISSKWGLKYSQRNLILWMSQNPQGLPQVWTCLYSQKPVIKLCDLLRSYLLYLTITISNINKVDMQCWKPNLNTFLKF